MTTHTAVPSDVDADSMVDLVQDCREISGVLGSFVPAARLPEARGAMPIEISTEAVDALAGYDDYGS